MTWGAQDTGRQSTIFYCIYALFTTGSDGSLSHNYPPIDSSASSSGVNSHHYQSDLHTKSKAGSLAAPPHVNNTATVGDDVSDNTCGRCIYMFVYDG